MSNKIFKFSFFTSMLVLLVSFLMIFSVLFDYFETQIFSELKSEASYISYSASGNYEGFINNFKGAGKRVTLISPNGTVLADTDFNPAELENHLSRREVKAALKSGSGQSERYSDTLTEKNLYYAEKLPNGNILRISAAQNSVFAILLGLMRPIIVIIFTALIISLFLSHKASLSIVKPINELDLDNPEENCTYEELNPLLKKLTNQKRTIKKQIKEAEKSREEFKLICENMNEGFLVLDKDASVLSYNSAALRLLGAENINSNNILTLNRSKNFRDVINNALCGKHAQSTVSAENNTYELIANPVYQSKKIIGAVVVIIDITEVAKREKLRREFTSNVSHELKTPLTSISGFAEMMKSGGTDENTVKDFSTSIYDEAQRLIGLVNDIMKISELDEGALGDKDDKVGLLCLSQNIAKRLKPIAEKNGISISVTGEEKYVLGNMKILGEMIYNLCDNAIKYNKPSGRVTINVCEKNGSACIAVSDTGIGIPLADRTRVFERFYRVDKSRSKSVGGTGLGLAIVKHSAMYHGANINLESEENKGTTISITF